MNRNHRSARPFAGKVCRKSQGVTTPMCDDRLAVRRGFAHDAVRIRNQEAAAEAEGEVALLIVARPREFACRLLDRGRMQ
jgi:hypothetical protein